MTVPFVRAYGDPYQAGHQHGTALRDALRAFLDDDLARINRLAPRRTSVEALNDELGAYSAKIAAATPALSAEIDGLADGAGLSRAEAVLLQVRREIIGYQRIPARGHQRVATGGDCTAYARTGQVPVVAQTVDLNGDVDDQIAVLDIGRAGSGRRALLLSFAGLLGYLGVNSDGLAVGLNLVLGGTWRPGVPPYLVIRHLLDNAGSVAEAIAILTTAGLPLASSRHLLLCDTERAVSVEILGDRQRFVSAAELVHTNHYLHPDFTDHDQLNVFARNSSLLRLEAAREGLRQLEPGAGAEDHIALLTQPAICVGDTGDTRREKTVAAVVLLPGNRELHLRPGDPTATTTETFQL
jgi:isopenicillin-N N-acyltransferase-like protein